LVQQQRLSWQQCGDIYLKKNDGAPDADEYGKMLLQKMLQRLFTALQQSKHHAPVASSFQIQQHL